MPASLHAEVWPLLSSWKCASDAARPEVIFTDVSVSGLRLPRGKLPSITAILRPGTRRGSSRRVLTCVRAAPSMSKVFPR
jgi:hypothetical protein